MRLTSSNDEKRKIQKASVREGLKGIKLKCVISVPLLIADKLQCFQSLTFLSIVCAKKGLAQQHLRNVTMQQSPFLDHAYR